MSTSIPSALSLLVLTLHLSVPSVVAAGTCSVGALDTVAGLGTEITVSQCDAGGSTTLTVSSPDHQAYTQNIVLDGAGNAATLIPSKVTTVAGLYHFTIAGKSGIFTVLADRADDDHSLLTSSTSSIRADGKETATITATIRDRYDNPVTSRPLALIASRLTDDVVPQSKLTDDSGRFLWTVHSTENGSSSLSVYDVARAAQMKLNIVLSVGQPTVGASFLRGSLTNLGQGGTATAADLTSEVIDHFELSLPQGAVEVKANELFGVTIRAMRGTDVARGYIGTLTVKSSDPDATLPKKGDDPRNVTIGRIEMRGVDQGERKVPLAFMLRNGGSQTIEVADQLDPTFTGKITLNVLRDGASDAGGKITILDPKDRATIKGGPVLLQGHAPSLINLRVKGGSDLTNGSSDQEGVFRISVPINAADKEVTLFVTSENGSYESDPVHILIDSEPPTISTITFDPVEPKAGQPAKIAVQSEPGLASVVAAIDTQTITLTEDAGGTGLYRGSLNAPPKDAVYDTTITAKDATDNTSTMLIKWTVKPATVPVVQQVKAEGQRAAVLVQWEAITGVPLTEYKIYIAPQEEPTNYVYSIGTKKPVTSAVIRDLSLGKTYQFSLTAIAADGSESSEKSAPATASPLGIDLKATAGKDSLLLEWAAIPSLPLDHYILQYGVAPGEYPERRTIHGQAASFVLRDLIGDVTYELKLTPVDVTGKELSDLSAIAHGTPTNDGFVAGSSDPVPTDLLGHAGAPLDPRPELQDVPENSESGIPSFVIGLLLVTALGIGLHLRSARNERRRMLEFLSLMHERYHS